VSDPWARARSSAAIARGTYNAGSSPGLSFRPLLGERRVDRPEDAVRFAVVRILRQRFLGRVDRFDGAILPGVQASELGAQFSGVRRERQRLLVGSDGLVDVTHRLVAAPEEKVVARVAGRGRSRLRGRWRRAREQQEHEDRGYWPHLHDYNDPCGDGTQTGRTPREP
jgi:hypothetical protein